MKTLMIGTVAALVLTVVSTASFAQDTFAKKHPRRAEVVEREKMEQKKNDKAAADGKITKSQDAKLDRQDRAIHREEKNQAASNGGQITSAEQRKDNKQEDHVNRERKLMERRDAAKAAGTNTPPAAVTAPVVPPAGN